MVEKEKHVKLQQIASFLLFFLFFLFYQNGMLFRLNIFQLNISKVQYCFISSYIDLIILPTILSYYTECCADTWGSEVGIISSTPYLLLLPWKPVPAGTNGGISMLGLGAACASAICMNLLYFFIQPSILSVFN